LEKVVHQTQRLSGACNAGGATAAGQRRRVSFDAVHLRAEAIAIHAGFPIIENRLRVRSANRTQRAGVPPNVAPEHSSACSADNGGSCQAIHRAQSFCSDASGVEGALGTYAISSDKGRNPHLAHRSASQEARAMHPFQHIQLGYGKIVAPVWHARVA
jgi:hypothetical protein